MRTLQFPFFIAIIRACVYARTGAPILPDSIQQLVQLRIKILNQITELGDFRKGSITATTGRCGKSNCRCHQPNQPGHGPNFRLTYKNNGKTVTESFPSVAAQSKTQREVDEFHRFQKLSAELLEVNEKICRLRPVEQALQNAQEKKRRKSSKQKSTAK